MSLSGKVAKKGAALLKWMEKKGKKGIKAAKEALDPEKLAEGGKKVGVSALGAASLGAKKSAKFIEENPKLSAVASLSAGAHLGAASKEDEDKKKKKKRPYLED